MYRARYFMTWTSPPKDFLTSTFHFLECGFSKKSRRAASFFKYPWQEGITSSPLRIIFFKRFMNRFLNLRARASLLARYCFLKPFHFPVSTQNPPAGTTMCMCGCRLRDDPHVWSTDVWAPLTFHFVLIESKTASEEALNNKFEKTDLLYRKKLLNSWGIVNTVWKCFAGRTLPAIFFVQSCCFFHPHFGHARFRHELYAASTLPHSEFVQTFGCPPRAGVRHSRMSLNIFCWCLENPFDVSTNLTASATSYLVLMILNWLMIFNLWIKCELFTVFLGNVF